MININIINIMNDHLFLFESFLSLPKGPCAPALGPNTDSAGNLKVYYRKSFFLFILFLTQMFLSQKGPA